MIDADAHVVEASLLFDLAGRWPEVEFRSDGTAGLIVDGRVYPEVDGPGAGCPPAHSLNPAAAPTCVTPEGVVGDADVEGVDHVVLFPSGALCVPTIRDRGLASRFADAYNDWLADFCKQGGGRLHGIAAVGTADVDDAVASLRRARDLGLVGVTVPPALEDRNLDDRSLDPLWAAAVDLDVPVCVHGAPGLHLPMIGADRFTNYVQVHVLSFPFDAMTALTALVTGGVFERHPALRVLLCEGGCGWLPFMADRLASHWQARGDWVEDGWRRHPREYFDRGNLAVTFESDEPMIGAVADAVGSHCLLWASDYPHWDGDFPHAVAELRERDDLADDVREAITDTNAARWFGLRGGSGG